jgi:hypothetical protein
MGMELKIAMAALIMGANTQFGNRTVLGQAFLDCVVRAIAPAWPCDRAHLQADGKRAPGCIQSNMRNGFSIRFGISCAPFG